MRPKPDHFDKIEKMTYSTYRIIPKYQTLSDVQEMV